MPGKVEGTDREIIAAIRQITGTQLSDTVWIAECTVNSVDEGKRLCEVEIVSGKATGTLPNVRLMPVVDDGILIIPAKDSHVIVVGSTYVQPFVAQYGEVDKIVMRGGELKGLLKLEKSVERWNNIEDDVNNLKTAFTGWTPVPNDGGAALKAATATWASQQLIKTQNSDVENDKITQG